MKWTLSSCSYYDYFLLEPESNYDYEELINNNYEVAFTRQRRGTANLLKQKDHFAPKMKLKLF